MTTALITVPLAASALSTHAVWRLAAMIWSWLLGQRTG